MPSRRPYDEVAYMIAVFVGIPFLGGLVFVLLAFTNTAFIEYGLGAAVATFVVGVSLLTLVTFKAYALLKESGGR